MKENQQPFSVNLRRVLVNYWLKNVHLENVKGFLQNSAVWVTGTIGNDHT